MTVRSADAVPGRGMNVPHCASGADRSQNPGPKATRRQARPRLVLANISNGLPYPHDDVCFFQSQHGHSYAMAYFRADAMPWRAVIHLLEGGELEVVDATAGDKPLTDALRYGVRTWCHVFNRALRYGDLGFGPPHGWRAARSDRHRPTVQAIRRIARVLDTRKQRPAIPGENVLLTCHRNVGWDDDPAALGRVLELVALNANP